MGTIWALPVYFLADTACVSFIVHSELKIELNATNSYWATILYKSGLLGAIENTELNYCYQEWQTWNFRNTFNWNSYYQLLHNYYLCSKLTSYSFIVSFYLNFRKMLQGSNYICFYEWKTQRLRNVKYVTHDYTANKRGNQDLDPPIQVCLVPKPQVHHWNPR